MSIPTDVTYTGCYTVPVDLTHPNEAISTIVSGLHGWTITGNLYASFEYQLGIPMVGTVFVGFSIVITNYFGGLFRFWTTGEPDPSGPGIIGVEVPVGVTQGQMAIALLLKMQAWAPNWSHSLRDFDADGTPHTIYIEANDPGPSRNNAGPLVGAILSGGIFRSEPLGGGYQLTSQAANGQSAVTLQIRNAFGAVSVMSILNGNETEEVRLQARNNYLSVSDPYQWVLFRKNVSDSYGGSGDIYPHYDNYWLCAPNVDPEQQFDADDPIAYCAFVFIRDRTSLNNAVGVTAINELFHEGTFSAFDSDVGISLILLNSMQTAAGALTTTADKYLQIQSLIALSEAAGEPLKVVGDIWDMYLVSKYFPLDTLALSNTGKTVIAYRSQEAPCEWTLWLALN